MTSRWNDRLKSGLKRKKLVYKDIAEKLNVTEGAVSHYLNRAREPSIDQVKKMAKMVDISVSELLGEDAVFISCSKEIKAAQLIRLMSDDKRDMALKLLETLAETNQKTPSD